MSVWQVPDKITDDAKERLLTVYLPDTRGVTISRFGVGNLKIGMGVHTYSRLPSRPRPGREVLGWKLGPSRGTCPGSSEECEAICYAKRVVAEAGPVAEMWDRNSITDDVPDRLPPDCKLLRLHVSGDFTSERYIDQWTALILRYPTVKVWTYTRSWRVPELLPALERLRALPNVELFASVDSSIPETPPDGWRAAWIDGDERCAVGDPMKIRKILGSQIGLVCPAETGRKANCEKCRYCFDGRRGDVVFLKH